MKNKKKKSPAWWKATGCNFFFAWCTFLTSHKWHWTPGRGLHSGCGLTLSYWRLYQIFITGRGLSGCSRHRGNALWRKTAEHHLRLLTRLQRPLRPPTAESGAAHHVWARTSDDAQWHHVYFAYSRAQWWNHLFTRSRKRHVTRADWDFYCLIMV